jgi:hypothetical protein
MPSGGGNKVVLGMVDNEQVLAEESFLIGWRCRLGTPFEIGGVLAILGLRDGDDSGGWGMSGGGSAWMEGDEDEGDGCEEMARAR